MHHERECEPGHVLPDVHVQFWQRDRDHGPVRRGEHGLRGLCDLRRDRARVESGGRDVGFSDPTTSTPSSNVRTTTDGRFRLTQSFTRDALEKEIIITMTVRNQSTAHIPSVYVARFFDGDIAGTPLEDKYSATRRSVFAHQNYAHGGLALSALTFNFSVQTDIVAFNDHNPLADGCFTGNAVYPVTPTGSGDWVGWVTYYLGTINAGASKIIKFVYRVL